MKKRLNVQTSQRPNGQPRRGASRPHFWTFRRLDVWTFTLQRRGCRAAGFTIIELLVVIGVIALVLGFVFPALRAMRSSAAQTVELSASRQLMVAYAAYAAANDDAVLPGYHSSPLATDFAGQIIAGGPLDIAARRYVWRLAPYIEHNLRGMYINEQAELLERLEHQDYPAYLYAASVSPSLGLNTEWIGGDSTAYGFLPPDHPLRSVLDLDRFYIRSMAQAIHPGRLMVFASARGVDPENSSSGIVQGYFKIQSPYFTEFTGLRWTESYQPNEPPVNFGFVSLRHRGEAVTAFIDGHVGTLGESELRDMRHWANWAYAPDWRLPQLP